ncbi:hypothetical protein CANCADRAFT_3791 [Tortispora caseinolytica NRRL Y-17796]|uniref:Peroxin-7 n=1 Tax=Tortispora caseinolytica NRRL Y-17796 TaxID=767744 RepID=A0A1E4TBP0_9ASCO|nr:hypothetical protein CANCADRAFT_3791 [Tortispora caseinolytica NRRL Y-17796]
MYKFRTQGYNGYSVKYSPFLDSKIACAASANFGLVGNGRLYVLDLTPNGIVQNIAFDTQDGLFDLAWSELHENQIVVAGGDGAIRLFDITLKDFPIKSWKEHTREVFSVNWNMVDKTTFCSSSWDGSIKIWAPNRPQSLRTLLPPSPITPSCTYQALYSPHDPTLLASVDSSGHLRLWDLRRPNPMVVDINAHLGAEALTLDWNKYRPGVIATGSVDRSIRIWDIRQSRDGVSASLSPINELLGHEYAVRKVSWSPHRGDVLLSASYDMTARVWTDRSATEAMFRPRARIPAISRSSTMNVISTHTEFVVGCDWSLWGAPGWAATCAWDETVLVFDTNSLPRLNN